MSSAPPAETHKPEVSVEVLDSVEAFDALEADWHRLSSCRSCASLFRGWAWNRLWWTHYATLGELFLIVIRRDGVVRLIAPFYRAPLKLLRIFDTGTLRFLGTGGDTSPDDLDVIMADDEPEETLDRLCRFLLETVDVPRFLWNDVAETSSFRRRFLQMAGRQGGHLRRVEAAVRLVQALPDSLETHRLSSSRNARKQRKRRRRRLEEAGEASFDYCRCHESVDAVFDVLVSLHRARHLSKGDGHSFASDAYLSFHRALMHDLLDRDELRLLSLSLNDRIIGVEYAFEYDGVLCFFQTGFDPAYEALSPGHLMMGFMIEDAIARGVRSLDLLKGDYPYKQHYASEKSTSWLIDYCKPGMLSKMSIVVGTLQRLKHRARSTGRSPSP